MALALTPGATLKRQWFVLALGATAAVPIRRIGELAGHDRRDRYH